MKNPKPGAIAKGQERMISIDFEGDGFHFARAKTNKVSKEKKRGFTTHPDIGRFPVSGRHVQSKKEVAHHGVDSKPWKLDHRVGFCRHSEEWRYDRMAQAFAIARKS
jgi:hypothetical protein